MKVDVQSNVGLPPKNEQVLFCRLSTEQRKAYKKYLKSREVESILTGTMKVSLVLISVVFSLCIATNLFAFSVPAWKEFFFSVFPL